MALLIPPYRFEFNQYDEIEKCFHSEDFDWVYSITSFLKTWFNEDYVEVKTSGSTGEPKLIRHSKQTLENSARMTNEFFGLNEKSLALLCLPASYIAGKMMIVRAIVGGFDLWAVKPEVNPFQFTPEKPIDFAAITPHQLFHSISSLNAFPLKTAIVGGGTVSTSLESAASGLAIEFYETFGMTETASHIALRKFNSKNGFELLKGVEISKDDRNCLVIHAPHLVSESLKTNDVVEIQADGKSFNWLGRYDRVVNSGGVKLYPEQIEKKIEPVMNTAFFIDSLPDLALGQKLVLFVEAETIPADLEMTIAKRIEKYEKPQEIICISEFVRSNANKILREASIRKRLF